jgi:TIR domain
MRGSFDVFFSYHTAGHATVTQVAQHLRDRGIRVFLDRADPLKGGGR